MRSLRWAGLVFSLLIVGVLGGLMAPFPSEAGTPAAGTLSLTLQVDNLPATPASLLITSGGTPAPGTCTTAEGTGTGGLGYTSCWNVNTSSTTFYGPTGGRYRMVRANANTAGRFRVADRVGQDKMSLVGVKFEPEATTWSTTGLHTLKIKQRNVFNSTVNVNNATDTTDNVPAKYSWVVRTAGAFSAPSGQTAVGDSVTFEGKGTFSSSLVNVPILSPAGSARNTATLFFEVEGPVNDPGPLSFDGNTNTTMGQQTTYPQFVCKDSTDLTKCRPDVTLTKTVSLIGPDSYTVVNGDDAFCANCALTAEEIADLEKKKAFLTKLNKLLKAVDAFIIRPTPKLTALIARIDAFLNISNTPDPDCPGEVLNETDVLIASANDEIAFAQINAKPAEPAPPHYYAVISSPGLTWDQARDAAQELGAGWHLAIITSGAEQAIINSLLPDPTDFPAEPAQQFWIGGEQNGEVEPGGNWQWINDEGPFWDSTQPDGQNGAIDGKYHNWGNATNGPQVGHSQPDNLGGQHHLSLDHRYGYAWDDNDQFLQGVIRGYVAEGPSPLPPPPVIE